jgi:hypothetical protein
VGLSSTVFRGHLRRLQSETIEIIREVFAGFKKAGDALLDRKKFE